MNRYRTDATPGRLMVVPVKLDLASFDRSAAGFVARPLFSRYERFVRRPGLASSNYDVTPDGSRFLMINDDDQDRQTSQQIIVVQGWANELNRLGNA